MIASDLSDLYIGYEVGESFASVAGPVEQWLRYLGWGCTVRQGPPPPGILPPLGEGSYRDRAKSPVVQGGDG
jgi:hypothetical protein